MPYHFLEFFFVLALLFLPWIIQQIKDNRDRNAVVSCCKDLRTQVGRLNRLLPDPYKLHLKEHTALDTVYQEYRLWLLMCYMEKDLKPILSDYHSYTARSNRKFYHPDYLKPYFGAVVTEELFFMETIYYFLQGCNRMEKIGEHKLYCPGDTLTDIGIVAYKIMLAVYIARETIGVHCSGQIDTTQKLLKKALHRDNNAIQPLNKSPK